MKAARFIGLLAGTIVSASLFTACAGDPTPQEEESVGSSPAGLGSQLLKDVRNARQKLDEAKAQGTALTPEALVEILQGPEETVSAIRDLALAANSDPTVVDALGDAEELQQAAVEYAALVEELGIELPFDASLIDQQCAGERHDQCAESMAPDMSRIGVGPDDSYSGQWYACEGGAGAWVVACSAACTISTGGVGAVVCVAACGVVYNHMSTLCDGAYEMY